MSVVAGMNQLVHELPAPGLFGKRVLVLPCNMPVEHLLDVESHLAANGYQAVLYDPERPDETPLKPYDWVYVLNHDGVPGHTCRFILEVDVRRVPVVTRWPVE